MFDDNGRLTNPSLLDYRKLTAADLPNIETIIVEVPAPAGPFGARGVGEPPIVPAPAAHRQRHRGRHGRAAHRAAADAGADRARHRRGEGQRGREAVAVDLKDKVALVAGGTGLLGTAIARALAGAGAHVAITYLERHDAAKEACAAVEALGRKAWSVTLDQTDGEAISAAVKSVVGQTGRLDILVNNAGWNIPIPYPDLEALDAAVWDRLFSTNLRGPYLIVARRRRTSRRAAPGAS